MEGLPRSDPRRAQGARRAGLERGHRAHHARRFHRADPAAQRDGRPRARRAQAGHRLQRRPALSTPSPASTCTATRKRTTRSRRRSSRTIPVKPRVKLFGTGGTIASRLDYRTGAVIPAFSPGELYGSVPELADVCNLETEKLYGVFSENMGPEQWIGTAEAIGAGDREGGGRHRHRPRHRHHAPHGGDPVVHGAGPAGADRHGRQPALQRPPVVRRRHQPDQRGEHRRHERHRRGHGLHVRPDQRPVRPAAPRHARAQDALAATARPSARSATSRSAMVDRERRHARSAHDYNHRRDDDRRSRSTPASTTASRSSTTIPA